MFKHSHLSWLEKCFANSHVSEAAALVNDIDLPQASSTPYTSFKVSQAPHNHAHLFFESQDMHVEEDIIFVILLLKQQNNNLSRPIPTSLLWFQLPSFSTQLFSLILKRNNQTNKQTKKNPEILSFERCVLLLDSLAKFPPSEGLVPHGVLEPVKSQLEVWGNFIWPFRTHASSFLHHHEFLPACPLK